MQATFQKAKGQQRNVRYPQPEFNLGDVLTRTGASIDDMSPYCKFPSETYLYLLTSLCFGTLNISLTKLTYSPECNMAFCFIFLSIFFVTFSRKIGKI